MTTQITVRLPDENVAWLDAEVAAGRFPSRTLGLAKLLSKAQRRQEDEADMLKILANPDPDADSRLEWMRAREYPPIDDDLSYDTEHTAAEPDPDATANAVGAREGTNRSAAIGPRSSAPKAATTGGRRAYKAATTGKKHRKAKTVAGAAAKAAGVAGRRSGGNPPKANGTTIK